MGSITEGSSDEVTEGRVISQSVVSGTKMDQGKTIDLVISTGSDSPTVPNVVGATLTMPRRRWKRWAMW